MFNINKTLVNDIGQVHYMVDSNFRTVAQGWSRADHTGPLDLFGVKNPGYVFYGPGAVSGAIGSGGTDTSAIQAAIDAMVDFRGDTLFFTPGNYTPATALVINVPDARWLGPQVSHPTCARAILTAGVANAFGVTAAADRMEVGYLQMVPLTAADMWDIGAVSGCDFHDIFYNADGIAASTSTQFLVFETTAEFIQVRNSYIWVDAAQGDWITCEGIVKGLYVSNVVIFLEAGSWANVINLAGVGAADTLVHDVYLTGGGTAITAFLTIADKTKDTTHGMVTKLWSSTVGPAANALVATTGADAELDFGECRRMTADATALAAYTDGSVGFGG